MKRTLIGLLLLACLTSAQSASVKRRVISLDGRWQIAQGGMTDAAPSAFDRTIPVPGLVDMAKPAFTEVGVQSRQRQAFWYRRTFYIAGPEYPIAMLKVNKAQFCTKVWLNGVEVGEHPGCFTPGYFDVTKSLRFNARNTLVVRVGASREDVPATIPTGTDHEKTIWTPGIYDSVSLILSGDPRIASVQVAPHISDGTITAQVAPAHQGDEPARLTLSVREWKSGRAVCKPVRIDVSEETVTQTIRLDKPHLWSPEDPFLYVLRCETDGDAVETRFGMREFGYDPKTGRAMLNGRPYFLRGTNFCMFRFFEDPLRGSLPWDPNWARKLLTMPKDALHWNSARVCIAPFPEFWYDIADETGWLLQDEYPIWGFNDAWSQDQLLTDFREWLTERWNHPSIVVWDACNETQTPRTGRLITAIRGMDLSNRPWDDGYSPRNRPGDAIELHPYTGLPTSNGNLGSVLNRDVYANGDPPVILNEYDAFWMQRDGGGTGWYTGWYADTLGSDATLDEKRELLAYNAALATEYWRARRDAAGVQWFCYLTYSKPGMVTSDNFSDMPNAVIEPQFVNYMSNAFSPLAVMIDAVDVRNAPGSHAEVRVIVTNDLYTPQMGDIVLRLGSSVVGRQAFKVDGLGQGMIKLPVTYPTAPGKYRLTAELVPCTGATVLSRRNVTVVTPDEVKRLISLSDHRPVTASSIYKKHPARYAVDRSGATRWSSQFRDPQWITVDLCAVKRVGCVVLNWETAYGKAYRIQASTDKKNWTDVYTTEDGRGGIEEITFAPVDARYVRMYGTKRATEYGYSLWSFQVFED